MVTTQHIQFVKTTSERWPGLGVLGPNIRFLNTLHADYSSERT